MKHGDTIFVTGHKGLLGSAIVRELTSSGYKNIWTASRQEVDLTCRESVKWFFDECRPDYVFHCAAKVGGIQANNDNQLSFFLENLSIQNNVMNAAHAFDVKKLLFVASAAVYPRDIPRALGPHDLLNGPFDETKEGYATAKLAGLTLCKLMRKWHSWISVIPNNLYGPGDTYTLETSHVLPAMILKFFNALREHRNNVTCWGTGHARREFIHSSDAAKACIFLMETYDGELPVNLGVNQDISMRELASLVAKVTNYKGNILWDISKPQGTMKRLLDSSALFDMGWRPLVSLEEGIRQAFEEYTCPLR